MQNAGKGVNASMPAPHPRSGALSFMDGVVCPVDDTVNFVRKSLRTPSAIATARRAVVRARMRMWATVLVRKSGTPAPENHFIGQPAATMPL
jgi:hypothetical protein